MPLSWNEIRSNAIAFAREWATEDREEAEAKSFWDDFFKVFGLSRRHLASFEEPVKNLRGQYSYIDLFWKGVMLAEHKSAGKRLDKAHSQAMEYIQDLQRSDRGDEVPQYVVVSDFRRIALHDLETDESVTFGLDEFHQNIHRFAFIPGYKQHRFEAQDPINLRAVQIMGDLHDALERGGYTGHDLERFLVRVLFCLFSEDTGIFTRNSFQLFLENHTHEDGTDLGAQLALLFHTLNTPADRRQKNLREELGELPYVNGDLFSEHLGFADFNRDMRNQLLACTRFDWSRISPAVFGALFQSVMEPAERRQIGAHYTSERDIMKVIGPLFLDNLKDELEKAGRDKKKLQGLHERLANIKILDPACGCGNFLVIAYRELRLLELEILIRLEGREFDTQARHGRSKIQDVFDFEAVSKVDVDQFYGIEIEEWPARIAEVAMWLMDHQMNLRVSEKFGSYFVRLPLTKSPHIQIDNALRIDWNTVVPACECTYVLGNPPFGGKKEQNDEQKQDMARVWAGFKGTGILDYVCCWYLVAGRYIKGTTVEAAFVSTNSISQGEQVGVLWTCLNSIGQLTINFAHRTFAWQSEARGAAHVHVVVIGFSCRPRPQRSLFEYRTLKGDPERIKAANINAYLTDAPSVLVGARRKTISQAPPINYGSMMIDKPRDAGDDEGLIVSAADRDLLIRESPALAPYLKRVVGGKEFIHGIEQYAIWLVDAPPTVVRSSATLRNRIRRIKEFREGSDRAQTVKLAAVPHLFGEIRQPLTRYLLIPKVSSMERRYIPMGFLPPEVIATGSSLVVANATEYHFGILSSAMHNSWMRYIAGRMKSDYQYSAAIVYNNFPWPQVVADAQRTKVEAAAQHVLDVRAEFPNSTLADLYDPLTMPAKLAKAHATLDRAVDRCYRAQPFPTERHRVEYLFQLYERLTQPLAAPQKKNQKPRTRRTKRVTEG